MLIKALFEDLVAGITHCIVIHTLLSVQPIDSADYYYVKILNRQKGLDNHIKVRQWNTEHFNINTGGDNINGDNVKRDCVIGGGEGIEGWQITRVLQTVPPAPNLVGIFMS